MTTATEVSPHDSGVHELPGETTQRIERKRPKGYIGRHRAADGGLSTAEAVDAAREAVSE